MAVVEVMVAKTKVVMLDVEGEVGSNSGSNGGDGSSSSDSNQSSDVSDDGNSGDEGGVALVMTATSMVVLLMIVLLLENVGGIVANAVQFLTRTRSCRVMSPIDCIGLQIMHRPCFTIHVLLLNVLVVPQ